VATGKVLGQSPSSRNKSHAREYTVEVVRQLPHDSAAFTQGLTYSNGFFYEGTGREGQSSLRQVEPETGRLVRKQTFRLIYLARALL
jgi:glutamine cyclotransferase